MNDKLIDKIHKIVNDRIFRDYPALDMANHPEGHIKKWEIVYILEVYEGIKK